MEIKIGGFVEFNGVKLKCVDEMFCDSCYLNVNDLCDKDAYKYVGECAKSSRLDNNSVIFVEEK